MRWGFGGQLAEEGVEEVEEEKVVREGPAQRRQEGASSERRGGGCVAPRGQGVPSKNPSSREAAKALLPESRDRPQQLIRRANQLGGQFLSPFIKEWMRTLLYDCCACSLLSLQEVLAFIISHSDPVRNVIRLTKWMKMPGILGNKSEWRARAAAQHAA